MCTPERVVYGDRESLLQLIARLVHENNSKIPVNSVNYSYKLIPAERAIIALELKRLRLIAINEQLPGETVGDVLNKFATD